MEPEIRIVRGQATPEELAAVTSVLYAVAGARAAADADAPEEAVVLRWPTTGRPHHPAGSWATTPTPYWRHAA